MWSFRLVVAVVLFPLFLTFRPSESYLLQWLVNEHHQTAHQVLHDIFPIFTYCLLGWLIAASLLSQLFDPKWIVTLGCLGALATLLIVTVHPPMPTSILMLSEAPVALYMCAEVIYASSLYRLVPTNKFQMVSSVSASMRLLGVLISSLLAQLLLNHFPMVSLFYTSIIAMSIATILALMFPQLKSLSLRSLPGEILQVYRKRGAQILLVYIVLSSSIHALVLTYWQNLFLSIEPTLQIYNAYLYAGSYVISFLFALIPSFLQTRRAVSPWHYVFACLILSGLLVVMSDIHRFLPSFWVTYACFVAYQAVYEFVAPISRSQLALQIADDSLERYGVIFAFNGVVALLFQTTVQAILQAGKLTVGEHFVGFGLVLSCGSVVFLGVLCLIHALCERRKKVFELH